MMQSLVMFLNVVLMRAKKLLYDEKGEVNIVAIVVLIGIAVVLALIFRKAIEGLIRTLLETITNKANEAVTD